MNYLNQTREKLELLGFSFIWGYSVYRVCIRFNNMYIGSFDSKTPYALSRDARMEMYLHLNQNKEA